MPTRPPDTNTSHLPLSHLEDAEDLARGGHRDLDPLDVARLAGGGKHGRVLDGGEQLVTPIRLVQEALDPLRKTGRAATTSVSETGRLRAIQGPEPVQHKHQRTRALRVVFRSAEAMVRRTTGRRSQQNQTGAALVGKERKRGQRSADRSLVPRLACLGGRAEFHAYWLTIWSMLTRPVSRSRLPKAGRVGPYRTRARGSR